LVVRAQAARVAAVPAPNSKRRMSLPTEPPGGLTGNVRARVILSEAKDRVGAAVVRRHSPWLPLHCPRPREVLDDPPPEGDNEGEPWIGIDEAELAEHEVERRDESDRRGICGYTLSPPSCAGRESRGKGRAFLR